MKLPKYHRNEQEYREVYNNIVVTGKTPNQDLLIDTIIDNQITFAIGPAGCGKTFIATSLGLKGLLNDEYERLIITRPTIESGPGLGFLPGNLLAKMNPYMTPIYEEMEKHLPANTVKSLIGQTIGKRIEVVPFEYAKGRNFHECFVVIDEFQNAEDKETEMFLNRTGEDSKVVLCGDFTQSDLKYPDYIPFDMIKYFADNVRGVGFVELFEQDIVRSRIVRDLVTARRNYNEKKSLQKKGFNT